MLTRLHLDTFGRFHHTALPLEKTTWIVGGHDSGKTTVCDAIEASLGGTTPPRYGDGAHAHLDGGVPEGSHPGLHVLPAGVRFGTRHSSEARERVLAAVSPLTRVAERVAELATEDSQGLELNHSGDELDRLAQGAGELWRRRQTALAAHAERCRLDELTSDLLRLQQRATEIQVRIDAEHELRRERAQVTARLEAISHQLRDFEALAAVEVASDAELVELDVLQTDVDAHRAQIAAIESRQADCRRRLRRVAADVDEDERRMPALERAAHRAMAIRARLCRFDEEHRPPARQVWHSGRVAAAAVFFLGAAASAALLGGIEHFVGLGIGMVLGTCTLAWGRKTIPGDQGAAERAFVTRLCEEWNAEPGLPLLEAEDRATFLELCERAVSTHEKARAALDERVSYKRRVELETAQILERSHAMLHSTLLPREEALAAWLGDHNAESRAEYASRLQRQKDLERALDERRRQEGLPEGPEETAELEGQAVACLELLSQRTALTDADLEELTTSRQEILEQTQAIETECQTLRDNNLEVHEDVAELARALFDAELEQERVAARITELAGERRAIAEAKEPLATLAADRDLPWRMLNDTLADFLAAAGLDTSRVSISEMSPDAVSVADTTGVSRPVDTLGRGSRVVVELACHLAVGVQLGAHTLPFLALDDPCDGLDERHAESVLALLAAFQRRTGWQLVVTSRTPPTGPFANARVIDLDAI